MELINASIPSDLSACAIERGLKQLGTTDLINVRLLVSPNDSFQTIFQIINKYTFLNSKQFSYSNVDTTDILKTDSWMLIDYEQEKIYYSPGA